MVFIGIVGGSYYSSSGVVMMIAAVVEWHRVNGDVGVVGVMVAVGLDWGQLMEMAVLRRIW